MKINEDYN